MELVKDTPLEVAWRVWQARPPKPSLTVVVKGTFTIPSEGECPLAGEQALPTGDLYVDDDVERSIRYPTDMDPLKPRGECFVVGSFHAPGGRPVQHSKAVFKIGAVGKQLAIIGDRYWRKARGASEPQPFETMELTWERALGGPKSKLNPLGRGETKVLIDGKKQRRLLPNIENPEQLVLDRGDSPAPYGCGPIPRTWASRRALAGTYDATWQATRYPWFPADLDWGYFNAAPRDQQIEGYWRGDETISLRHLHPQHARVDCRLPGIRAHAFLISDQDGSAKDLGLVLDTITVDADAGLVHCVWRGVTEVGREDLSDIRHLFVADHGKDDAPGVAGFEAKYKAKVAAQAARRTAALDDSAPGAEAEREVIKLAEAAKEPGAKWAHLDQALTMQGGDNALAMAFRQAVTTDPNGLASVLENALGLDRPLSGDRELTQGELLELEMLLSLSTVVDKRQKDPGRVKVREALKNGETDLTGWDLCAADLSELDISGLDLRGAVLVRANLSGANFRSCRFDGAVLVEAELSLATFDSCAFNNAVLANVRAHRVRFHNCRFDDAEMPECYLREARLAGCQLPRTVLSGSDLAKAVVHSSSLDEADLSRAILKEARFRQCSLKDTSIEGASGERASFDGCEAPLLRASQGAMLDGASFKEATLDGARFGSASLRRANFSLATLRRANFMNALALEGTFTGCDLRSARFDQANLISASFVRANLMQARLEGANLTHADLRGASLYQAELLGAKLDDARLEVASLEGTRIA